MNIQYIRHDYRAPAPSRAHSSDIGLDLVAIDKYKTLDNGVILYDTGISVIPPDGYYVEIVPRSSISKTGWTLANNVGIIDPDYRGHLYIALVRLVPDSPEMQLPFCKCQMILRKAHYAEMEEITELSSTERGDGGFGSTG